MAVDLFNRHFDFPVLLAIRDAFESGTWDGWMRAVTALGDHGVVWIALGVALLLFSSPLSQNEAHGSRNPSRAHSGRTCRQHGTQAAL